MAVLADKASAGLLRAVDAAHVQEQAEREKQDAKGGVARVAAQGLRGAGSWLLKKATPESIRLWGGFL